MEEQLNNYDTILDAVKNNDSPKVLETLRSIKTKSSASSDSLLCNAIDLADLSLVRYLVSEKKLDGYWSVDNFIEAIELCASLNRPDIIAVLAPALKCQLSRSVSSGGKKKAKARKIKVKSLKNHLVKRLSKSRMHCSLQ